MTDLARRGPPGQKPLKSAPRKGMRNRAKGKGQKCPVMESAKGEQCLADWCGCGGSTETTVMCHVQKFGISGMGMKGPNFIGFYGCYRAHMMLDQAKDAGWTYKGLFRALVLTQCKLWAKGLVLIGETQ